MNFFRAAKNRKPQKQLNESYFEADYQLIINTKMKAPNGDKEFTLFSK